MSAMTMDLPIDMFAKMVAPFSFDCWSQAKNIFLVCKRLYKLRNSKYFWSPFLSEYWIPKLAAIAKECYGQYAADLVDLIENHYILWPESLSTYPVIDQVRSKRFVVLQYKDMWSAMRSRYYGREWCEDCDSDEDDGWFMGERVVYRCDCLNGTRCESCAKDYISDGDFHICSRQPVTALGTTRCTALYKMLRLSDAKENNFCTAFVAVMPKKNWQRLLALIIKNRWVKYCDAIYCGPGEALETARAFGGMLGDSVGEVQEVDGLSSVSSAVWQVLQDIVRGELKRKSRAVLICLTKETAVAVLAQLYRPRSGSDKETKVAPCQHFTIHVEEDFVCLRTGLRDMLDVPTTWDSVQQIKDDGWALLNILSKNLDIHTGFGCFFCSLHDRLSLVEARLEEGSPREGIKYTGWGSERLRHIWDGKLEAFGEGFPCGKGRMILPYGIEFRGAIRRKGVGIRDGQCSLCFSDGSIFEGSFSPIDPGSLFSGSQGEGGLRISDGTTVECIVESGGSIEWTYSRDPDGGLLFKITSVADGQLFAVTQEKPFPHRVTSFSKTGTIKQVTMT